MFANSAADAMFGVNIRLLKPYLDFNMTSRRWRCRKGQPVGDFQTPFPAADNSPWALFCGCRDYTVIIARGKSVRSRRGCLKFNIQGIGPCHYQCGAGVNRVKSLPGSDCFGTDRAVFLADNTGSIHGPGQATASVDKSRSDFYGSLSGKAVSPLPFVQTDGPDGRRRAQMATGNTIKLTPAGADTKIKSRRPQPFNTTPQAGRMNHVSRANTHALTALDTA